MAVGEGDEGGGVGEFLDVGGEGEEGGEVLFVFGGEGGKEFGRSLVF